MALRIGSATPTLRLGSAEVTKAYLGATEVYSGAVPFTPASLPGLMTWYDAGQLTGLSDGDQIASWPDLSGNGRTMAQATSSKRPLYKPGVINGKPTARFDGVDDVLLTAAFPHTGAFTIFMVEMRLSGTGLASPVDADSQMGTGRQFQARYNGANFEFITFTSTVTPVTTDTQPISAGVFHVTTVVARAVDAQVYVDGASNGATSRSGTNATATTELRLGAGNGGNFGHIDLAEVVHYGSALSDIDRSQVRTYLATKYGL